MRPPETSICCAVLCGLLAGCAEDTPPASTAPETTVRETTAAVSGVDGPEARVAALVAEMTRAYRDAPVLISTSTLSTTIGGQARPDSTRTIRFGPGSDIEYDTPFFRFLHFDRTIYVTYFETSDRYLRLDDVDDIFSDVGDEMGKVAGRLPETNLRFGRPGDEVLRSFALGMTGEARVSGQREITGLDGRRLQQISLVTVGGSIAVNVDPTTKLLHSIETEEKLADAPVPNLAVFRRTVFETKIVPEAEPVVFDPGDRLATDSAELLRGVGGAATVRALKVTRGERVPDFTLHTILGSRYALKDSRGRILVLVFWASWDTASREAMRQLTAITPWAREKLGVTVEVIGVCGMRRQGTEQEYWDKTLQFWEREELPLETLFDRQDAVFEQLGVLGVPMTLVLDADGRFVNAVGGFGEGTLETVAQIVEESVAASAGGGR